MGLVKIRIHRSLAKFQAKESQTNMLSDLSSDLEFFLKNIETEENDLDSDLI